MIKPNVRASFGRREAEILLSLSGPEGELRLREGGIDALLDDAEVVRAFLRRGGISSAPAPLAFYLLVRHAFLARQIIDRQLADYTAALLLEFGLAGRAFRIGASDETEFYYLTDIIAALEAARGEQEFLLRVHLGNFALWIGGIFPDHVTHRVQRRGAPPLSFYDEVGAAGFRSAAAMDLALRHGLGDLFLQVSAEFGNLRSALNSLTDDLFFPRPADTIERVLREVKDSFERRLRSGD